MLSIIKRSSRPSIINHNLIQRLKIRQLSSSPIEQIEATTTATATNTNTTITNNNNNNNNSSRSNAKWLAGAAGISSGLGLMYYYLQSSSSSEPDLGFFKKPIISLADWSTIDDLSGFTKFSLPDYSSKFLFGDAFRRKIFFNYEKRIRLRSPPEKVFDYFSSVRTANGESLMKPTDLMRAIVPVFPPSESNLVRDGYLEGERNPGELRCSPSKFFMLFDVDNDGLISFKEYIFFVTLLGIPESRFSVAFKMFDTDNSGEIDREEFKKVMAMMRTQNRQGASHRDGLRTGLKVTGTVENGGLVEYFFGKDGNTRLHHDKFVQFMRDLQDEILTLEFTHYDYKSQGTILAKDFALSMVAAADMSHLSQLLDRVDEMNNEPHFRDMRITLEEFKQFAELRNQLQPFSFALFSYGKVNGLLTREDFKRAASHVCGVSLTDNVVEIIFLLFDKNRDGSLSSDEFVRVLHKRQRDIAQPVDSRITGFFPSFWNCTHDASTARLLS
ncbi:hypothetical protein ACFE04_012344 [Oxalis oulophora]